MNMLKATLALRGLGILVLASTAMSAAADAAATMPLLTDANFMQAVKEHLRDPGPIEGWNTSRITDMKNLFIDSNNCCGSSEGRCCNPNLPGASAFNADLSGWNTSAVVAMHGMFRGATSFNHGGIGGWETGAVTNMAHMFLEAYAFNQRLDAWDTALVTDMSYMFLRAHAFSALVGGWNTGAVTNMKGMFLRASSFNKPIGEFNTGAVTDMNGMLALASSFNQPLDKWNVAAVTDMGGMFNEAASFNQPISNWDTAGVTDMNSMAGMFSGTDELSDCNKAAIGHSSGFSLLAETSDWSLTGTSDQDWSKLKLCTTTTTTVTTATATTTSPVTTTTANITTTATTAAAATTATITNVVKGCCVSSPIVPQATITYKNDISEGNCKVPGGMVGINKVHHAGKTCDEVKALGAGATTNPSQASGGNSQKEEGGISTGVIVGIVIGVLICCITGVMLVMLCLMSNRKAPAPSPDYARNPQEINNPVHNNGAYDSAA